MDITINRDRPYIEKEDVFSLSAEKINDFYCSAGDFARTDFFFILLNSFIAFNIAYYLFILLTPPSSEELSLHFINEALKLEEKKLYYDFKALILNGN